MPHYRITLMLQNGPMGGSETYYTGNISESSLLSRVEQLIGARNPLLFTTTSWQGIRISVEDQRRRSVLVRPGLWAPTVGRIPIEIPQYGVIEPTAVARRQDQWRSVLQLRFRFDVDRQTQRYLLGIPDSIIKDNPGAFNLAGDPAWKQRFDQYVATMMSGSWYLKARARGAGYQIITIADWVQSQVAPAQLGVALAAAPPPGISAGDWVTVQGVRLRGNSRTSYNGKYLVSSVNATLIPNRVVVFLRDTEAGDPSLVRIPGTIQRIGYDFYPINEVTPVQGATHKRGRPTTAPRGRRSTRTYLGS